ncbi:MAG: membrane protein insertase YidC, partial [Rhodoferax sp.]
MNDIRRTILWVIFGFSMVLLWDQWQVYNGHKATFFPGPAKLAAPANPPLAASSVPSGVPATNSIAGATPVAGAATDIASNSSAAPAPHERVVVTTDVLKLTFDTEGGSLVQTEF